MPVTTTTQVDPEVDQYFDNVLLDREQPDFIFGMFAQQRRIPQKNSKTAIFRRYDNLADALTPLTEGVTPASEQVSKFDITAVVSQYGKVVELSDDVVITVQDETSNEVADMLTQNMHSTYDKIIRNMLHSTASQLDCVNGSNGNAVTELSDDDHEEAIDYLRLNNGKRMTPIMPGSDRFGTAPVYAAYWAISHEAVRKDIKALSNFEPRKSYSQPENGLQAELGAVDEVRFCTTTEAYVDGTGAYDIYDNIYLASNGYGKIEIDETSMEMIIKPLGAGEDALNQRQTMGWKGRMGAVILDDSWVVNLRASLSA